MNEILVATRYLASSWLIRRILTFYLAVLLLKKHQVIHVLNQHRNIPNLSFNWCDAHLACLYSRATFRSHGYNSDSDMSIVSCTEEISA